MNESPACAWAGKVTDFLATPKEDIMRALSHQERETGAPQLFAWRNSIEPLAEGLKRCLPEVGDCGLILEYELPLSGGRRPDLIFLNNGTVLVIEFKNRMAPEQADFDQVLGYVRDLREYHAECHEKTLIPVLVPIGFQEPQRIERGVRVVSTKELARIIREVSALPRRALPNSVAWAQAAYSPMPALVEAARLLFEKKPLPRIRTADAEDIPGRVAFVERAINEALKEGKRLLILITGAPGSGKTLVGLQIAHLRSLKAPSVMLSGNGPLVSVLQYVLDSTQFVKGLKSYLREHLVKKRGVPPERVLIFDEAQRAWDRDRVLSRHQGDLMDSEPALILSLANRVEGGFVVIGLMGEGQEIHAGEESGIQNWVDAVKMAQGWTVLGPPQFNSAFSRSGVQYTTAPKLHLTASLRSRRAGKLTRWVECVLSDKLDEAALLGHAATEEGFPLLLTRSLERAREYLRTRYEGLSEKRIGIIASSKFRKLEQFGVSQVPQNFYYYGQWYEEPEAHSKSGSRLETAISEFGCQGLELDMPLLCWGPDLRWNGTRWESHLGKARLVKDPHKIRLNAYRVLMTRGRDGLVIFVPPIPELDQTAEALRRAGVMSLT